MSYVFGPIDGAEVAASVGYPGLVIAGRGGPFATGKKASRRPVGLIGSGHVRLVGLLPALAYQGTGIGLPIGGQLIGRPFGEETLLGAATVLERTFPAAVPPWVSERIGPDPPADH